MDWSKVVFPKYNPFAFELARHSRGWTKTYLSLLTGLPIKTISAIENGDITPTDKIANGLADHLEYPIAFFEQWHETRIEILPNTLTRNVPIDYYLYPIFRKLNTRMSIV